MAPLTRNLEINHVISSPASVIMNEEKKDRVIGYHTRCALFVARSHSGLKLHEIDAWIELFPMSSGVSERASERMSAADRASEASSAEQAYE